MSSVGVDLVCSGDDEEERRRRKKNPRRAIGAMLFVGALFALLPAPAEVKLPPPPPPPNDEATSSTAPTIIPVNVDPATLDFGDKPVGTPVALPVGFTNPGTKEFITTGITTGLGASDFTISADECAKIAPHGFCAATITFSPRSIGAQQTTFTLRSETNASLPLNVRGNGIAPPAGLLSFETADLDLGTRRIGVPADANVRLTNAGNAPLTITALTPGDAQFAVTGCAGTTVAAGGTCDAHVTFVPQSRGATTASLTATDDGGRSATMTLHGLGTLRMLRAATPDVNVPSRQLTHGQAKPVFVTFENAGDELIAITGVSVSDERFRIVTDECLRQQLQPAQTCRIAMTTSAAQNDNATLTLTGDGVEAIAALHVAAADVQTPAVIFSNRARRAAQTVVSPPQKPR
jgi:hypothetical protein